METLIARIRIAISMGVTCDQMHDALINTVSEEDFFLAWRAAQILDRDITNA